MTIAQTMPAPGKYKVGYRLAGFDPKTELLVYSQEIPLAITRELVQFGPDDPQGYASYGVDYPVVMQATKALNIKTPPEGLDYFVEGFDAEPTIPRRRETNLFWRLIGQFLGLAHRARPISH